MDLATTIGFVGGIIIVVIAMAWGGSLAPFISFHGFVIVFMGGFFAVMCTAPMDVFIGSIRAMGTTFKKTKRNLPELITLIVELSNVARKDGVMALEGREVHDKFMQKGLQMLVDGADEARLQKSLKEEIAAMKARHASKQDVVKAWVELGPAFGMIGTLIGLIEMLGNMSDPASIGAGMSTALIGTLYGAIAANVFFGPIASKMKVNTAREVQYREMVIQGLRAISRGDSPRLIQDAMVSVLPPFEQTQFLAA